MAKSDHLDQAQQASAASIPALRAVIAGVREHEAAAREYLDGFSPRIRENVWALVLLRDLAWEITTLADACERLAEENERLREQLTAAEAAREAVLASLAAAEAVAGEVRGEAAKAVCHYCRVGAPFVETPYVRNGRWHQNDVDPLVCSWCSASAIHALPTPSAALQRVREQEAERALMEAWMNGPPITFDSRAMLGSRDRWVAACMARLFPTPDAGGK